MSAIPPDELARYSRQIILPNFGTEGQARLKAAKLLVVGAGGLGSPASMYLAAAGVGTLGIADYDKVEIHNLHRQLLHDSNSLGTAKLQSARTRLEALNPHTSLEFHEEGIRVDNVQAIIKNYDLILDGSDNFPTRFMLADACYLEQKPLVSAAIFRFEGQLALFNPASNGPCYRCLFPQMPEPGSVPNCAEAGVLGALCGIMGSLQALEAVKLLIGLPTTLEGTLLHVDTLSLKFKNIQITKDPDCPLCGKHSINSIDEAAYRWSCGSDAVEGSNQPKENTMPIEVDVEYTKQRLDDAPDSFVLLDVREPFELDIAKIDGAAAIPLASIADAVDTLDKNTEYIVLCHHGMRSLKATHFLRDNGFRASSMKGGIHEWAECIDPSLQRY